MTRRCALHDTPFCPYCAIAWMPDLRVLIMQTAEPEMLQFMQDLRKVVCVGIVGGSDLVKISEQLGANGKHSAASLDESWIETQKLLLIATDELMIHVRSYVTSQERVRLHVRRERAQRVQGWRAAGGAELEERSGRG
eukprot:4152026-Pyramimonas_sp.AAC.1